MPRQETWSFPSRWMSSHRSGMKNVVNRTQPNEWNDQRIRRGLVPPTDSSPTANPQNRASTLVGEWQDRGPETPGAKLWKLRLALAPAESVIAATVAG